MNYDGTYHGASREHGAPLVRRGRSLHQPVRRLVVLARRVRGDSPQGLRRLRSGVHAARARQGRRRGTWTSSAASIACSPSAPTSARRHATVPTSGFTWHQTWQPVVTGPVADATTPPGDRFTTVMTWKIESFTDVDGNKDREFVTLHRPAVTHGHAASSWRSTARSSCCASTAGPTVDAMGVSRSLWDYRDFIQRSRAEFGVAKHAYVAHRSGWFSDRTECYLAAGRPALVQDTGWSSHLPDGHGADRIFDAGRGDRRPRADRARLRRRTRGVPTRSRASTSTRRGCCRASSRSRVAERPLRIALVAPVAQPVPPPRSGSIETLTALLADGLVARGHDVTLFATGASVDSGPAARRLRARLSRGSDALAVGAVRAVQPRRGGRARRQRSTSSTTRRSTRRCRWPSRGSVAGAAVADGAPPAEPRRSRAVVALSAGAVRRGVARAGARPRRLERGRHHSSRGGHRGLHVPRRPRATTCCSSAGSPKGRACCRRSRWRAGPGIA